MNNHNMPRVTEQTLFGFDRDDLEAIADGLEAGYDQSIDVGGSPLDGNGQNLIASTTMVAAKFIRAALTRQHPPEAPTDDLNDIARYEPIVAPMGYDHVPEMAAREDGEYVKLCDVEAVLREQKAVAPATQPPLPAVVKLEAFKGADTKQWHVVVKHPFGTSWVKMNDPRDTKLAELLAASPAATTASTNAAWQSAHDDIKGEPVAMFERILSNDELAALSDEPYAYAIEQPNTPVLFLRGDPATYRKWQADGLPVVVRDLFIRTQAPSRDAAPTIDCLPRYKLVPGKDREWMAPAHDGAWCMYDHARAALARAPLPAQGDAEPAAWMVGRQLFISHDAIPFNLLPPLAYPVPMYLAAPAQAGDARDAKRYQVLRSHVAPGDVRISMRVPRENIPANQTIEERIDMLCDQALAASAAEQKGPQ